MCTVKEAAVPKAATVAFDVLSYLGSRTAPYDQKAARYPPSRLRRRCFCLIITVLSLVAFGVFDGRKQAKGT